MEDNTQTQSRIESIQQHKTTLTGLLTRLGAVVDRLENKEWRVRVDNLLERTAADNFKVIVLGEFKRGKSTLINALLGQEVLPAYALPCTAIISVVKWGPEPKAWAYGPGEGGADGVSEISLEDLTRYVTDRNYEKIELQWPLPILENGIEIIDSPGLNEDHVREKVTLEHLSKVDAILFVLACDQFGSRSEMGIIDETLIPSGHEDLFFVCNRFDLIQDDEKDDVVRHARKRLGPMIKAERKRLFFVSARRALDARVNGLAEQLNDSGIPALETALQDFLSKERGRVKLMRTAKNLKDLIRLSRRKIAEDEAMIRAGRDELEKRYEEAKVPLDALEARRKESLAGVALARKELHRQARVLAGRFQTDLAAQVDRLVRPIRVETPLKAFRKKLTRSKIEQALKSVLQKGRDNRVLSREQVEKNARLVLDKLKNKDKATMTQFKEAVRKAYNDTATRAVEEVTAKLTGRVEHEFYQWMLNELTPMLSRRLDLLTIRLHGELNEISRDLDRIREDLTGVASPSGGPEINLDLEMEPIGLPDLDVSSVWEDIWKLVFPEKSITQAIKAQAAAKFKQGLLASVETNSLKIADSAAEKVDGFEEVIEAGLGGELKALRVQVETHLSQKVEGSQNIEKELQRRLELSQELDAIDSEVDEMMIQTAMV